MCYHSDIIDSRTIVHRGRTLTVTVMADPDAAPTDVECYTAEDVAAWYRDEWCYVGVLITEGPIEVDALWRVEFGCLNASTTIDMDRIIADHPVPDMLGEGEL